MSFEREYKLRSTKALETPSELSKTRRHAVTFIVALNIIVALILPIAFASQYPSHPERFGADWGPLTLSGQWWRLLTSQFVHIEVMHLLFNMLGLWFLGKRLEKLCGSWMFLALYLTSGLVGDVSALALHPEVASYGASTCVLGIAGAIIVMYGVDVMTLSWAARCKLAALIAYVVYIARPELSGGLYVGHTAGLLTGMCFATCFKYFAKSARSRYWTFAVVMVLLTIVGAVLRHRHRFV